MRRYAQSESSAEEANKERLAEVLSRMLVLSQERQNSTNEYSNFLEMKWINDTNPEVQAARGVPGQGKDEVGKNSMETEAYGLVLNALEDLISDTKNMSRSIENKLDRDTREVESLSCKVNLLNARIRCISERKKKRKTRSRAEARPHEPKLLPLWTPTQTPVLSSKANVFHRKALVSRLVTGMYYDEFKQDNDDEEAKELEEEIREQEAEIRRETALSKELEEMALEAREMSQEADSGEDVKAATQMPEHPYTPLA